jgi:hypothetical protein
MFLYKPLLIVAFGVTVTYAKCYGLTTGDYGQTEHATNEMVDEFCDHELAGYFTEGETKYGCSNLQRDVKGEFWVKWMGSGDLTLDTEDCKLRLKNEVNGCKAGGASEVADWYFR